ncbi:MAG: hypothetical protein FJX76_05375 [Armatimonadetes bacterium]|nr:hypothetical protein [Armatimonadota bacterium]
MLGTLCRAACVALVVTGALLVASAPARALDRSAGGPESDPGVISIHPLPAIYQSTSDSISPPPRYSLGLENGPPALVSFYGEVVGSYRSLEPLVLDLPEYAPGFARPDLMPSALGVQGASNEPRREMIRNAIRQAFGRALSAHFKAMVTGRTKPEDPPMRPPPLVNAAPAQPDVSATVTPSQPQRTRYMFGVHRLKTLTTGVDVGHFSIYLEMYRGGGTAKAWALVPIRGPGIEGNFGISSRREIFTSVWIRF